MTKRQAIQTARDNVSEIYRFGENYRFAAYDKSRNAWSESLPTDYWQARAHRSEALILAARKALGYNNGDEYVQYDGGHWTDYVHPGRKEDMQ